MNDGPASNRDQKKILIGLQKLRNWKLTLPHRRLALIFGLCTWLSCQVQSLFIFLCFFFHMFLFDKRPCLQLEALVRSVICSWRGISRNLCTNSANSWRDPLQDTLKEIDDEDAFDPQTSVIYRMLTSPLGERLVPHYGDGALATCPEELHIYVKTTRSKFLKVNGCITSVFENK